MSVALPPDVEGLDADEPADNDHAEAIAAGIAACELDLAYFKAGNRFLNDNYVLLGYHITDPTHHIGELDDDVKSALNVLAIEIARRMGRVMRNDLPTATRKADDLG